MYVVGLVEIEGVGEGVVLLLRVPVCPWCLFHTRNLSTATTDLKFYDEVM